MKLLELITEYNGNGYIVETRGNGSTHPMFIELEVADLNDLSTELSPILNEDVVDIGEGKSLVYDFASDWITTNGTSQYRLLF
jgi:hypothetical protein